MTDRVMLLIDADNVSVDIIEQAVEHLLREHGALHVRRAYCTAESAVKHHAVFRRLSIKPMVNLSTGKNSTDIALAVDAVDLVLAERPDVVAIASSDSDFAPLVARLREKGCRVVGIGQEGKTGDETLQVYDAFTVMAHRKSRAVEEPARPARKTAARGAAKKTAAAKTPKRAAARKTADAPPPAADAAPAAKTPAAKTPARKTASRRKAAAPAPAPEPERQVPQAAAPVAEPPAEAPPADAPADPIRAVLAVLPELERGGTLELRVASMRLRDAGLLTRSGSSTRLFGQFADRFELTPPGNPNHVRLRAAGDA